VGDDGDSPFRARADSVAQPPSFLEETRVVCFLNRVGFAENNRFAFLPAFVKYDIEARQRCIHSLPDTILRRLPLFDWNIADSLRQQLAKARRTYAQYRIDIRIVEKR
jgi:hypothetical protein